MRGRWFIAAALAAALVAPAVSQDVRNTYIAVAAQVADGVLTNAKLANMANSTVKCRITSGTGVPEDCTGANVNTITGVTTNGTAAVGQLPGTTTNDAAAAGKVGEIIESTVLTGAAVALTNNTAANITSISLTAGDWNCWSNAVFNTAGGTLVAYTILSMGTVSATLSTAPNGGGYAFANPGAAVVAGFGVSHNTQMRVSLSGTTTFYAVAQSGFTVSTQAVYGYLGCRRVR